MVNSHHKKNCSGDFSTLAKLLIERSDAKELQSFLDFANNTPKVRQRTYQRIVSEVQEVLRKATQECYEIAERDTEPLEDIDLTKRVTFVEAESEVLELEEMYSIPIDDRTVGVITDATFNLVGPITVLPNIPEYTDVTLYLGRVSPDAS